LVYPAESVSSTEYTPLEFRFGAVHLEPVAQRIGSLAFGAQEQHLRRCQRLVRFHLQQDLRAVHGGNLGGALVKGARLQAGVRRWADLPTQRAENRALQHLHVSLRAADELAMPAGKGEEAEIRLRCRQQQLVAAWRVRTQFVLLLLPLAGDHPQEHLRRRDPRCPHAELHRFSTHHPQVSLLKAKLEGRWRHK
jgi:hypothetical protein